MYIWKCWRDTRTRFLINLILIFIMCAVVTIIPTWFGGAASYQRGKAASGVENMWASMGGEVLGEFVSLVLLIEALNIGAGGIGAEFREPTLGFLFTRPRRRRNWVWTCWLVGAWELFMIALAAVVGIFGGLIYLSGHVYTWRLLAAALPLSVGALAVYTATFFLTAVARSSEKGLSFGLGILMIDLFLPVAAYFWHRDLTSILGFTRAGCAWAAGSQGPFPGLQLTIYAALIMALGLGTQFVVERMEV